MSKLRTSLIELILSELKSLDVESNSESKIFGTDGVLDSLGLVNLTVSLEESILDNHNVAITLADERAMSRSKSPFRSVESLAEYIEELLMEDKQNG